MNPIRSSVIEWLDDTYHFGEAEDLIGDDDRSLLDHGVLDSLGYVNLTLFLEKRFALKIDRRSLTRDNFDYEYSADFFAAHWQAMGEFYKAQVSGINHAMDTDDLKLFDSAEVSPSTVAAK